VSQQEEQEEDIIMARREWKIELNTEPINWRGNKWATAVLIHADDGTVYEPIHRDKKFYGTFVFTAEYRASKWARKRIAELEHQDKAPKKKTKTFRI